MSLLFNHENLVRAIELIVSAGGSEPEEARLVADNLVSANLLGHDSHGIGMIPRYVDALLEGGLAANQRPSRAVPPERLSMVLSVPVQSVVVNAADCTRWRGGLAPLHGGGTIRYSCVLSTNNSVGARLPGSVPAIFQPKFAARVRSLSGGTG